MINLMFCGNSKIFDGILIALLSIAKNTKEPLSVYVLTMDLTRINMDFTPITESQRKILEKKIQEKNINNKVNLIDVTDIFENEMSKSTNIKTHYTPYIFIRLLSDEVSNLPGKILYLDCDIVCYGDIGEIYETDMDGYEIAASLDYIGRKMINPKYMNSGVVLMNLDLIKKTGSFKVARQLCIKKRMVLPDQTALNKACKNKLWLPDKYNEQKKRSGDTLIRHFSMAIELFPVFHLQNIKPWQVEKVHKTYKIYDYEDIIEEYKETKKLMDEKTNIENELVQET